MASLFVEKCDEIDAASLGVEPACRVPGRANDDVGALVKHFCDPVRPQIGAIADADFARDNIGAIDDFGLALVSQFEGGESFTCQVEDRMDTPPAARFA